MRRARKGHFLIEMIVTMGVVGAVVVGSTALMSSASRSMDRTASQVDADAAASVAIQQMMEDLREAKRVEIVASDHLRIYYPLVVNGAYDRRQEDPNNRIDFYRSDDAGTASSTGHQVWRQPLGQTGTGILPRPVSSSNADARPRVAGLTFSSSNPSSVDVSLQVNKGTVVGDATVDLTHRAIFLRNY